MSTHEPTDGHADEQLQRGAEHGGRVPTKRSALSPAPGRYSVEVAIPRSPWLDFHFHSPLRAKAVPAAVTPPSVPGHRAGELHADRFIVSVPMSFGRSAERIWAVISPGNDIVLAIAAAVIIGVAWCVVLCWYVIWSVVLVPYRLIRRPRTGAS